MSIPTLVKTAGVVGGAQPVQLRAAGACLVLDVAGPGLPRVLHWGADLGDLDATGLAALAAASQPPLAGSSPDAPRLLTLLPSEHDGWSGTPGLSGHRSGADSLPRLLLSEPVQVESGVVVARAAGGGLDVELTLSLDEHGIVRVRTAVTNTADGVYDLAGVVPLIPVPARAGEVLDLSGRWCRERSPERSPLGHGTHWRAGRRGRSGHDGPLLLSAGTPGFGFRTGQVWSTAVAWSGESVHLVEKLPEGADTGSSVIGGGELLRAGEVRLAPGERYESPETLFVWSGAGLDGASARLHRSLRARSTHPHSPRPLTLNIWEAVYFDHDLASLVELADVAASIGVERFVVDDGWFGSRRNDTSGLGDWYVSEQVWPDGLEPLFDHVRSLGMQVGLWFEPEMANPDSDVVRAHPEWVLTPDAPVWRHQQVLDLAHPGAYAYLLERLDTLVSQLGIDFIKWDHNRDLQVALHRRTTADGGEVLAPGVHTQTLALYRLLDELRRRHPALEIESCAGGGGRVDLGILARTDRVWTSDCNDALERQAIQRWTGLVLPPELMGAHVGPPTSHTTGRVLPLAFRCATALFAHAGLEWDIRTCTPAELEVLRAWSALYRRQRELLHSGDVVRADTPDDHRWFHGVVAADRRRALYAHIGLRTALDALPGRMPFPGLDPELTYAVTVLPDLGPTAATQGTAPSWMAAPLVVPGSLLTEIGLPLLPLDPGGVMLLEVSAVISS